MVKRMVVIFFTMVCKIAYADCTVPEKLTHKDFLAVISGSYSPENPMAGELLRMAFFDDGHYTYQSLKDGKNYSGTYTYELIKKNMAVITAREKYNGHPVEYSMTLVCSNQISGSYIYRQTQGINDVRSNSARYFLMEKK